MSVVAQPPTDPYFTIEATITDNAYWGYYGGYHDIWAEIVTELAKLNITLTIEYNDDLSWWDRVWDTGWNHTGDTAYPPGGWDVTMLEWWLQPHAIEPWFASMHLNTMVPEDGYNIHPWLNAEADSYCISGMTSYDALTRKHYLWLWQEEFMHDPPIAEIYYPRIYDVMGSYVLGYDPAGCWWYDVKHLDINETKFDEVVTNTGRIAAGKDTLFYAVSEELWSWNPMFMETYTEENMACLVFDTLYTWTLNWTDTQWEQAGIVEPEWWEYVTIPELAADYPTILDGPHGPSTRMRVPLRTDVLWNDGVPFNATDVKFTFDLTFDQRAKCSGTGDFAHIIESVELVPKVGGVTDPYTGEVDIDPYAVDFILYSPHPDFTSIIANDWGGGSIVPWHTLKDVNVPGIRNHASNFYWDQMLPGTGPFNVTDYVEDDYIELTRNDLYWGYGEGYGPYVSKIILKWVPEAATRLLQLQDNTIDFGEYPTAHVSVFEGMMSWDNVKVYAYDYPASNGVWFNLDNPYLSNRYVRQAIAHAIPYEYIFTNILTGWGIATAYPGKSYILPVHYYDDGTVTVHLFNDDLEPYTYDLTKAQQYLDMWYYSQVGTDYTQGPVGDADFSGKVNFDDWFVWWANYGDSSSVWPWTPGCDVDPDFDNNDAVNLADYDAWRLSWGNEYPFAGAR
jgi:ABC-type transport system substrate-binding protein